MNKEYFDKLKVIATESIKEAGFKDLTFSFNIFGSRDESNTFVPSNEWNKTKKCDKGQQVVGASVYPDVEFALKWLSEVADNPEKLKEKGHFSDQMNVSFYKDDRCTTELHQLFLENAPKAKKALELFLERKEKVKKETVFPW